MKQKISRLLMTLALLVTAVGGAWAQSSPNVVELKVVPAEWEGDNSPVTAGDLPGFKTSTLDEAKAWTGAPAKGAALLIYAFDGDKACYVSFFDGEAEIEIKSTFSKDGIFGSKSHYKFFYTGEITEWSLTPDETGKKWTLDKMPASNIELQVEYFAESNLFLSKEALADKTNIAVKAGDLGVQFGDDGKSANTVTEGTPMTVTYNGTKKVLGMKVEKKAPLLSIQIGGIIPATIYYVEGETWGQAIQNHPTENSAWKIDQGYITGNGINLFASGNPVFSDSIIDPNADYALE